MHNQIIALQAEVARLKGRAKVLDDSQTPRPLDEWHEDDGNALWWFFPVEEPPYCGTSN